MSSELGSALNARWNSRRAKQQHPFVCPASGFSFFFVVCNAQQAPVRLLGGERKIMANSPAAAGFQQDTPPICLMRGG